MRGDDEFLLTAEELRAKRRKRRRLILLLLGVVLLLVLGFFGARPASHAIKAWQARRHAERAFAYIDKEEWNEARNEAAAAYQLRPNEPQVLRALARFLSRTRQSDALEIWTVLGKIDKLTPEDLRDEAAIALISGETTRAADAVRELLSRKGAGPADWLVAAQLAQQNNAPADARSFAQKILDNARADEPTQFQAALLLLANTPRENTDRSLTEPAWARLKKLSEGQSKTALDALVVIAQQSLTDQAAERTEQRVIENRESLAKALESHPLGKAQHKLLAIDLRIRADESQRDTLITRALEQWKNADPASLVVLATWLNGKGEYQKALDTVPLEKAVQSRDLFLQHLDSLAALEHWAEVKQLLTSERFPLDPVVQQMYLARCSAQLGERTAAENSWQRAVEAAAGDVGKLMEVGDYAEKNGNIEIAEAAYTNAAMVAPKLRIAQQGRLRIAQGKRDTRKLHSILTEMLAVWPNDSAVQNDEAYTRLLLMRRQASAEISEQSAEGNRESKIGRPLGSGEPRNPKPTEDDEELQQTERLAEQLVQGDPTSLPHRTLLALARLRQGRAADALRVYENVQVAPNALTPSALAVHAAALEASGHHDDAQSEIDKIKPDRLLPEEQALIASK